MSAPDKKEVFIADSESSSVRSISLADGAVKGVVGGAANPMVSLSDITDNGLSDGLPLILSKLYKL